MRALKHQLLERVFGLKTVILHPELRVAYSIKSHLTAKERLMLYKLSKDRQEILEIGSYLGASATCFGASKIYGEGKIYCIDTWNNDAMTEGKKDTFRIFSENTARFQKSIVPVRGFSTEVVNKIRALTTELDLLFIDGDHSYEGVKADWDAYKTFLKVDSLVIFHDIGWAEGVRKVIEEEVKPLVKSFDSLPNMWWGTMGRKP